MWLGVDRADGSGTGDTRAVTTTNASSSITGQKGDAFGDEVRLKAGDFTVAITL